MDFYGAIPVYMGWGFGPFFTMFLLWVKILILAQLGKPLDSDPRNMPVSMCTVLGWDTVNFPHSSLYGAIFCICDEKGVDNTGIF